MSPTMRAVGTSPLPCSSNHWTHPIPSKISRAEKALPQPSISQTFPKSRLPMAKPLYKSKPLVWTVWICFREMGSIRYLRKRRKLLVWSLVVRLRVWGRGARMVLRLEMRCLGWRKSFLKLYSSFPLDSLSLYSLVYELVTRTGSLPYWQ